MKVKVVVVGQKNKDKLHDGKSYILKHILTRERGILAINEDGYEFFIRFCDFKVILDTEEGGI